ncbi:MAG TPA: DMT family transporter [Rhodothermales bacterium]
MNRPASGAWKNEAALFFTVLVWGLNFPILKGALAAMHPHVINGFRFLISALVLGSLYVIKGQNAEHGFRRSFREHGKSIVLLSLTGYLFYQLFFILGIARTSAGNAALIMAGSPLWTAVAGRVFGLETLSRRSWLGLLILLTGTVVVVVGGANGSTSGQNSLLGNALMLGASVLWGGYTAFSRPVLRHLPATTLIFYAVLIALPALLVIAGLHLDEVDWSVVDAGVWGAIVFSGGLSTGIVFVFWSTGIRKVGASQTAAFGNLVPLVALGASFLLLGETIRWVQVLGGGLIIGGLVMMRRGRSLPPE